MTIKEIARALAGTGKISKVAVRADVPDVSVPGAASGAIALAGLENIRITLGLGWPARKSEPAKIFIPPFNRISSRVTTLFNSASSAD